MNFTKALFLILLCILAVTPVGSANIGGGSGAVPARLRVRVENQRVRPGQPTKVIVEFLDRNYGQVVNDATRVIYLGHESSGSKVSGSGQLDQYKIVVKPGVWSGEASFTPNSSGRLFITAKSEGLEPGQALVLIASEKSVSLLSRFVSLFETVAHAQDDPGFEILPKAGSATANGRHRASFMLAFLKNPAAGTTIRITTNLTQGGIFYKDKSMGPVADIKLDQADEIPEISFFSAQPGDFDISVSVRPDGPTDKARVAFTTPRPAKIMFDDDPTTIGSDAASTPLTVRLADEGGFLIEPDSPRTINFSCATDSDQVSFEPKSVTLAPGQSSAQVLFRLQQLPPGDELKLLATTDGGIHMGRKSLIIKSAIEKLVIDGPDEVHCGGNQGEYTIYLGDTSGKRYAADWNRQIDLNVSSGELSTARLVIPKGERKAVFKYTSPGNAGRYTLTASSGGINNYEHTIVVTHKAYWLAMFALLGGLVGGIARQIHRDKKFGRILPRWHRNHWDMGFVGRLAGSLAGALFFYWTFKLGLSQALGTRVLPVTLDLGTQTVAFFLGGIGGFAGTYVLEKLTGWFLADDKPHAAPAHN